MTSHRILWRVIIYPCCRYLLITDKFSFVPLEMWLVAKYVAGRQTSQVSTGLLLAVSNPVWPNSSSSWQGRADYEMLPLRVTVCVLHLWCDAVSIRTQLLYRALGNQLKRWNWAVLLWYSTLLSVLDVMNKILKFPWDICQVHAAYFAGLDLATANVSQPYHLGVRHLMIRAQGYKLHSSWCQLQS